MHVAIDCRVVNPGFPGIGRAVLETVRALVDEHVAGRLSLIVGPAEPPAELAGLGAHAGVDLVPLAVPLRAPADQWALPLLLRRLRPDLYHATYYAVPALVPGPLVVTIHDLIPWLFPQYWPNPLIRTVINGWTAYAARRGIRIITPSQSAADDVARLWPRVAAKVRVVTWGVTERFIPCPSGGATEVPYLLYVGSNKPHKNLPRLVAAFARIAPAMPGVLVIAGAWDKRYPQALELTRQRNLGGRVVFEHWPSDERLSELYATASGFVFPSLYEGFGLPVLEAMAAGLPVATSGRGSLGEVAGNAALLFDPTDETAIAAAMRRLLGDAALRERLGTLGRARAAAFSWERAARETWAVYEEALDMGHYSQKTTGG